jgi:Flp pilus assembly secretin CpaC
VIGGLMENVEEEQVSGIPGLDRIPLIGRLFRHKKTSGIQRELIVILTPHIWKPTGLGQEPAEIPPAGAVPPAVPPAFSTPEPGAFLSPCPSRQSHFQW